MKVRLLAKCAVLMCITFAAVNQFSFPVPAQTFYGSIVGTVSDPSGGVIPGASVSLTNIGTSENRAAVTDSNGTYRFVNLVPGRYRLEIELTGFKRLSREPIAVEVEAAVRIDAVLQVGNITETVSVTSETPLLQTESSSLSQVIEGRHVEEMPLNGRNTMNLIALVPGVVAQGGTEGSPLGTQHDPKSGFHTNGMGWGNYQIGGGLSGTGAIFLDGVPVNVGGGGNNVGLIASQEAVQEFRVVTNNASSEFGRTGGGVVNMTTKSGTNEFHGSAYEFFRNEVLNANTFFGNAAGLSRPAWIQNQFGASVGGPVRKDNTFFFFNYEGYRIRLGIPATATVPTAAMRAGDFSGTTTKIYDPLTTTVVGGTVTRTQFANNTIPANRIDPAANHLANNLKVWALPNVTGQSGYNYFNQAISGGNTDQYNARMDQRISDKQRLFGRYTYWNTQDLTVNQMNSVSGTSPTRTYAHNIIIGDTYTLTSKTVLDIRGSYLRQYQDDKPMSQGTDYMSTVNAPWANLQKQVDIWSLPRLNVSGIFSLTPITALSQNFRNNYALSGSLTHMWGRHSMKFGGEVRLMDLNKYNNVSQDGFFQFDTGFTSSNATTAGSAGGNAFASFMLGYPYDGGSSIQKNLWTSAYSWYQGYYFNDEFQAGRKLTLNYGVRWELPGSLAEKHDLASVFLPNGTDPLAQKTGMNLKGYQTIVNTSAYPDRTITAVKHNLFAPRFGFAYRITDMTVFRGGYGLSYLPNNFSGQGPSNSPIASATTTMLNSVNNLGRIPFNTMSNPWPASGSVYTVDSSGNVISGNASAQQSILSPQGRNQAWMDATQIGSTAVAIIPDVPYPYVQLWNLNIQQQLPGNLMFEIGYAGSKGTHLLGTVNYNQLSDQYLSLGSALTTSVPNPFYGLIAPNNTLGKATTTRGQLLRPYPDWLNVSNSGEPYGNTSYNAMTIKMEKRFGAGGVLMGNYTWAKLIGNVDSGYGFMEAATNGAGAVQNYNNLRGERSLLAFNLPHRVKVSYVLDLPFGKGKKFLSGTNGAVSKLVSGWGVNGIVSFQNGFPLAFFAQSTALSRSFGAGTPRPNVTCDAEISGSAQSRLNQWFNTACFSQPGDYSYGNEARVDPHLSGPGVNNWDFTIFKNTGVTERVGLQFRAEVFNLFNRVQFYPPGTQLGNVQFGKVTNQLNTPRNIQFALRLTF